MPVTKFTNLDFDQIKTQIKEYLRANSNFTDFDFEGSNFSVLIDALAYNTYISAFNSNLVVNESFLDSATLRENVVSLARNIGYVPRSKSAARASISFNVTANSTSSEIKLQPGLVCVGRSNDSDVVFSISEEITASTTVTSGIATASFGSAVNPIDVLEGTFLTSQFIVDGSLEQRFVLDNANIDTSSIVAYVGTPGVLGKQYKMIDNIVGISSISDTYLIQEVQDERYELLFGDGVFGRKPENGAVITVQYVVTSGSEGNGPSNFNFAGNFLGDNGQVITPSVVPTINTISAAANGGDIESVDSIKYFAPRLYSSQYRAVTARDYESIVQQVYPNTESVSVVGGEEVDPPQFGTVLITIKPKNGEFVSDFDKTQILTKLKSYSLTGINQKIVDLQVLYVEVESFIYYDTTKISAVNDLKTKITSALTTYSKSGDVNKFGGRFKYSKVLNVVDNIDKAITSNITRVRIRRNLNALVNQFAQYELCFGNQFNVKPEGLNIKSTGFKIQGTIETVFFTDVPNADKLTGTISIVRKNASGETIVVVKSAGVVDYVHGEINLSTINIISTDKPNDIVEIQAFPESNDVIGLQDLYLDFNIPSSQINMVKDTITSGEQISGVGYKVTSSYSNGELSRT
ncbi:MAG: baseplate wedge protein [Crocinitomicaceae bacterium]|nr:baseplate wedge protein [Crocinitomicaceae bacterium]|tara:strand:- start:5782 stop:7683 length:1902 start_codon:yes stop_codon:yes gene_type:complete